MVVARGETYNYARFRMSNYELGSFPGPKAGEPVDFDYSFVDLDGQPVELSQYKGKWLVLESGSLTCPMYVKNVPQFGELAGKFPDVEWLVIYVREAHPGSKLAPSTRLDDKIVNAGRTRDEYDEQRKILIDSPDGKWHHDWGLLPNMVYVINPQGTVVYRADWSFARNVEKVLNNRDQIDHHEHLAIWGAPPHIMIGVTLKAGWDALYDIVIEIPRLLYGHIKTDFESWRQRRRA